jgi:hypothetical protein
MIVVLRSMADRDAALREHVETTHYFDEATGELYEPTVPPEVGARTATSTRTAPARATTNPGGHHERARVDTRGECHR